MSFGQPIRWNCHTPSANNGEAGVQIATGRHLGRRHPGSPRRRRQAGRNGAGMARTTEQVPLYTRLMLSATSGCVASTITHPLDVVRVQLQTVASGSSRPDVVGGGDGKVGSFAAASRVVRQGGVLALWDGLSAAYMRQFSYSMVRIGLFSYMQDAVKRRNNVESLDFGTKLVLGSISGTVGSVVGNPGELAIVRMCNDSKLPPEQRRNYRSSLHAVARIAREEGPSGLMRGVVNSSARAAVLNAALLSTYSQAKESLVQWNPSVFTSTSSILTMFCGSLASSFWAVGASMPLDVVKSRLMSMPVGTGVAPVYTGMVDCARKSFQADGIRVFWRGFLPAYVKLAPYTVISFIVFENLTRLTGHGSGSL